VQSFICSLNILFLSFSSQYFTSAPNISEYGWYGDQGTSSSAYRYKAIMHAKLMSARMTDPMYSVTGQVIGVQAASSWLYVVTISYQLVVNIAIILTLILRYHTEFEKYCSGITTDIKMRL
jgi:hypothetical protein